ncbi:hypothetical protein B7435_17085 [Mycolicibacterium peregrinum]|uniref:hypothetical protein n=1 Tax=Mycolicibacterium peregrinum TaxID=43304 RepID=UPI000B767AF1|nr:hypothetical protein [Mycolicibacterium peregrinum]OWM01274.1 hypothetical protein B7435_17085 [Mycolicibacterium peregrinum]
MGYPYQDSSWQQHSSQPYPPAPPLPANPYGYGYPPNMPPAGGYPPAQPYQHYGMQSAPPYYPPPAGPQPERDNSNSGFWKFLEALMFLFVGRSARSFGGTPRARVTNLLAIVGVTIAMVAIVVAVSVLMR